MPHLPLTNRSPDATQFVLLKCRLIIIVWVSKYCNFLDIKFHRENLNPEYYNRELRLQKSQISRFLDYNRLGLRIHKIRIGYSNILSLTAPATLRSQLSL